MYIYGPVRLNAVFLGVGGKILCIVNNYLQHESGGHLRAFRPNFNPAFRSRKNGARITTSILAIPCTSFPYRLDQSPCRMIQ